MTLDGLERRLRERFPKTTIKGIAAKVNLVRYADDFIVTAATKELLEQEVKPLVEVFMKERGLALSEEKTCITRIEEGFDFLGQNVRKYKTGNHESAGKRLSGRTTKGSPWLRKLLVEAAHAAEHTKKTYLSALYRRIRARGGAKKAMIAVGHAILVICYHLLDRQISYEELGGNYFDEHDRQATEKRLVQRLEKLGYHVELQEVAQVA